MLYSQSKLFLIIWLLSAAQLSNANPINLLQSNNLAKDASINQLTKTIQTKYPTQTEKLKLKITLALGVEAIENALNSNLTIHIASAITEAETLQLTRKYPNRLQKTVLVLSQPGFKCQIDLFKKHTAQSKKPLGILLKNETLKLYPFIKNYAEHLAINVTTWKIQLSESLSDGIHHLMKQQDVLLLLAMPEFNQSSQLSVILQETKILKKSMIASSEYQIEMGVSKGCIIKNKDWIITLMKVIEKINKNQNITSNYQLAIEQSPFKIIMPAISIIE